MNDLKYAVRSLRQSPVFAVVAVITLALGIGATTALFTIVNAVILRPPPFADADRIVSISEAAGGEDRSVTTERNLVAWRESARTVGPLAGYGSTTAVLTGAGEPVSLRGTAATASLFEVLRVGPEFGRTFRKDEEKGAANRVVVLSHGLWQNRFGADAGIVGKIVQFDGVPYTVLGVMPATFDFPRGAEFWRPRPYDASTPNVMLFGQVIGRMAPGVALPAVQRELQGIVTRSDAALPAAARGTTIVARTLHDRQVAGSRQALILLLGAVGALLLIACANVANLLLTRATVRQRDFAVRVALGASRWRLARHLLAESLLLSTTAAAIALVVPAWSVSAIVRLSPSSVANVRDIHVDATVLLFTLGTALATGVLFAMAPIAMTFRRDFPSSINEGNTRSSAGGRRQRVQGALVVGEVAIALMLVTGGGLLTRSLAGVMAVDTGFQPDHLLTADLFLRRSRYPDATKATAFFQQLAEQVRAIPGVEAVALTNALPFRMSMTAEVHRPDDNSIVPGVAFSVVSRDYFSTLQIPRISGRVFDATESHGAAPVVVISATAARLLFPAGNAVGSHLPLAAVDSLDATVIGIVKDVPQRSMEIPVAAQIYMPLEREDDYPQSIVVRSSVDPRTLEGAVRAAALRVDPLQPVERIQTMDQTMADLVAPRRFNSLLLDIFAALALVLASVGLYGVMAYQVAQRTRELGVRMALGANGRSVLTLVLRRGALLAALGIAAGLVLSLALTRLLANLLFGVSVRDPATFVAAPFALLVVTALACLIPGIRATRVDPVVALRSE